MIPEDLRGRDADVEGRLFPTVIEFTVYGVPAPKGSKRGFVVGGHAVIVDDNRPQLLDWNRAVKVAVDRVVMAGERIDGPVGVRVRFLMPRPKGLPHRRRVGGLLVPIRHWPTRKPDLDKLVRALLDPMSGVLFSDDAQIVELTASKDYALATADPTPRAEVTLWQID